MRSPDNVPWPQIERDGAGVGGASRQASESGLMPNLYSGTSFNPGSVAEKHRSLSSSGLSDSSPVRADGAPSPPRCLCGNKAGEWLLLV